MSRLVGDWIGCNFISFKVWNGITDWLHDKKWITYRFSKCFRDFHRLEDINNNNAEQCFSGQAQANAGKRGQTRASAGKRGQGRAVAIYLTYHNNFLFYIYHIRELLYYSWLIAYYSHTKTCHKSKKIGHTKILYPTNFYHYLD